MVTGCFCVKLPSLKCWDFVRANLSPCLPGGIPTRPQWFFLHEDGIAEASNKRDSQVLSVNIAACYVRCGP